MWTSRLHKSSFRTLSYNFSSKDCTRCNVGGASDGTIRKLSRLIVVGLVSGTGNGVDGCSTLLPEDPMAFKMSLENGVFSG